jgi:ABC-type uncharacterized transport system involved in gliding motility auxiliary subunit
MRRQNVLMASSITAAIALATALLLMVNWLSYRHYARADWTSSKLYSLSEKTQNILKSVTSPVRIVVFMTSATPLYGETKELLSRYQAASKLLSVEYIDPERDPLRTQTLAKDFGVSAANTVVFIAGDRKKYVTSDQLAEYDYSGYQMGQPPKMKAFKGEEQFTSAIMGVVNPKTPKVCFSTGHGERDLDGPGPEGLSQLKEGLKRDNLETEKANLLGGSVPDTCDMLVVAGPEAPFTEPEKAAFKAYLDKGGRAMVLLDPVLGGQQRPSGLEDMLKGYGVLLDNDLVVDPGRRLPFFDLSAVYVNEFRSHPVVEGMQGLAVILPVARSVSTVTATGATATTLLTTSAEGWGETDLAAIVERRQIGKDPKDVQGPVSMGVAAQSETDKDKGWRLVVFGNSAFVTNAQVPNVGNINLAQNAINWLVKRVEAIGIAPRNPEQVHLTLSEAQMRSIFLLSVVGLPLLAVALGVAVWWRRRR